MAPTLIIGCGYLGRRVATRLASHPDGDEVTGLVQSEASAARLRELGIRPLVADLDRPLDAPLPSAGADVFHFLPPPAEGREDPRSARLLETFARDGTPRRLVYVSTTGVYGDSAGEWVDETRPAAPQADRAHRRWDAEQRLRQWSQAAAGELVILRVAGIYGPGKLPLARLRKGLPVVAESESPYTNRIHVEDLVSACVAAMRRGENGGVYNVSDGRPGTMADYFGRIAARAGLPAPPQIRLAEAGERLSAGMASYMAESRRLSNRRLTEELGVELAYPDLESGLDSCFEGSRPLPDPYAN